MYILSIYSTSCDNQFYHMLYTMYLHVIFIWYTMHVQSIYLVHTKYIHICICTDHNHQMHSIYWYIPGLYQEYTKYIQSESMKVLKDLDLMSVWILVCAVIGLHSTWQSTCFIMSDWCLIDHQSNVISTAS